MEALKRTAASIMRYGLITLIVWTICVSLSLIWDIYHIKQETIEFIKKEAVAYFKKDQAFRLWAASYGGIYVSPDDKTPPNSYLSNIPDRDVVTSTGRNLTLVNPAYMMRLILNKYSELYGVMGHLTSLRPIRPENRPDEWEAKALIAFEGGLDEMIEITSLKGQKYLRLMRPLKTEKKCLKCHGYQGYKEGDIRGGLSISVPFMPYMPLQKDNIRSHEYSHLIVWLIGAGGIMLGTLRIREQAGLRDMAEAEAREAKEEWEKTFDSIEDPICILDTEHRIVRANRVMAEKLGVSPEKAIGLTCYKAVHNADCPIDNCPHKALLKDSRPHVEEVYEERLGGYFLVSVSPLFDKEGKLTGSVHMARNITERKHMEEQIRKSESQLKEAQQIAHIGCWDLDLRANDLAWSDEIYRIFEINQDEFGASYDAFLDAIHPEDRAMVDKAYTDSLKNKSPYEIVHRLLMPDGRIKLVHERCKTYFATDGTPMRSLGTIQDVTEQKKAEDLIRESQEKYQTLFDSDQVGIAIVDDEGKIGNINNVFSEMLGYSNEELAGRRFGQISHTDELEENIKLYNELIHGKRKSYTMEKKYIHKQGHTVWANLSVFGVYDKSGKYRYGFAMIRDITKSKTYEENIESSLNEKSILLAEIHHRVKNNMQVISSLLSLQSTYIEDPTALLQFTETRSRIQAMALAHEMLYKAKDFSSISVKDYVESLMKTTLSLHASDKTKIKSIVAIDDIKLDPDTLIPCGLILNELLTNSIKHAFPDRPEGTIEINMKYIEDDIVSLKYKDNGKGFPEGYEPKDSEGLGLKLIYSLTGQINGTVEITNDNGALLLFTFPEKIKFAGNRHSG